MSTDAAFFARLSLPLLLCLFASGLLAQKPNAALPPFEPAPIVLPDAPPPRKMSEVRAINTLAEVLPPPKLVMRKLAPKRLER